MTRAFALTVGLLLVGHAAVRPGQVAIAQGGFTSLFDGKTLQGWNQIGNANWSVVDGAMQATMGTGMLVTPMPYGDFQITMEFWVTDDANSGVFIRCADPQKIGADTCYEVNVYDRRPGQEYRTGAIVDLARIQQKVDAGGKWNTLEITARGPKMTISVNGIKTAEGESNARLRGPFALQFGAGMVKFRKVEIRPL